MYGNLVEFNLYFWRMELYFTKNKDCLLSNFSEGFSDFLERKHYKTQQIAKILGVTDSAVSSWKYGRTFPDVFNLLKLIELGLSTNEILGVELNHVLRLNNNCADICRLSNILDSIKSYGKTYGSYDDELYKSELNKEIFDLDEENKDLENKINGFINGLKINEPK